MKITLQQARIIGGPKLQMMASEQPMDDVFGKTRV